MRCNRSDLTVWYTYNEMAMALNPGSTVATAAFATFTAPPFPWRICVANTSYFGREPPRLRFREVGGVNSPLTVYFSNASRHFYESSSVMAEGDYATIRIKSEFAASIPTSSIQRDGDSVKLVPAGFPCSYEKSVLSLYCGSSVTNVTGSWWYARCRGEGSVQNGVARIGTNALNPFVDSFASQTIDRSTTDEIAYLKLPVAGQYDICYSPLTFRAQYQSSAISAPLYFKLFKYASIEGCISTSLVQSAVCRPETLHLTIQASTVPSISWSTIDESPNTWGVVEVKGAGLSSQPAVKWDCLGCTKEYFNTSGGDMLRIVPVRALGVSTTATTSLTGATVSGLPAISLTGLETKFGRGESCPYA